MDLALFRLPLIGDEFTTIPFTCSMGIYVPTDPKEHIANIEQIVYSTVIAVAGQGKEGERRPLWAPRIPAIRSTTQ